MPFRESLRYALRVVSRITNVFIVAPVSSAVLMLAFLNNFSFYEFAYGAASYFRGLPQSTSIETWANEAASQASLVYWILVLIGLVVNIVVMGPREFFMMHPPIPEQSSVDRSKNKV